MNKVLDIRAKKLEEQQYLKVIKSLKFAKYKHTFITKDGSLMDKWFIVLKDKETGVALEFTPYTRLLRYSDVAMDLRRSETVEAWAKFVCMFLNYILIDNYESFKIDDIKDITIDMGNRFLQAYADGEVGQNEKTLDTVRVSIMRLCKLFSFIKSIYKKEAKHIYKYKWKYRDGMDRVRYNNPFTVNVEKNKEISEQKEDIFRNMPVDIFEIFIKLSKKYYPELTFAIALQAYAGLRPGEVCNVRQAIDPKRPGMQYIKVGTEIKAMTIDLRKKYQIRADGKSVGGIKKRRRQEIYTPYVSRVYELYKEHLIELEKYQFEDGYYPMFVDKNGKALTVKSYREKIERLANNYLRKELAKSDIPRHRYYADILTQKKLSPHFLRHYFTVLLVMDNKTPHEIAVWRGDKNLDSALAYCRDKDELLRSIREVNEEIVEDILRGVSDE